MFVSPLRLGLAHRGNGSVEELLLFLHQVQHPPPRTPARRCLLTRKPAFGCKRLAYFSISLNYWLGGTAAGSEGARAGEDVSSFRALA